MKTELNSEGESLSVEDKIQLVKKKIEHLSDLHQHYMQISVGSGSAATDIIEQRQSRLFKLLDELQGKIA